MPEPNQKQEMKNKPPNELHGVFFFDPADNIYDDHFPGNPVVPGSLVLHAFMKAAQEAGLEMSRWAIEDFRFKRFISPGEYRFCMHFQEDQSTCECELYDEKRSLVTGILRI